VRSALMGGRLTLNGNLFYNDYRGLQLPFDVAQNPAAPATVIRNAQKASTYGVEAEVRYRVAQGVDFTGGAGLLKTRVDRYNDPSIQGNDLPRAPAFTLSGGVVVTRVRNLDVSVSGHYTDAYYSDVFNNARGKTKPYAIADAQVGYRIKATRVFLAVNNLFDDKTAELLTPGVTAASDIANMTRPRRVSAGVELAF
jgi:iron complex outermembrane receptor protein